MSAPTITAERVVREDTFDGRTYTHPVTGVKYPSVTTILGRTDDKSGFLGPWNAKLAARFAAENLDMLVALRDNAGPGAVVDVIKGAAGRQRAMKADAGSYVHAVIEALIQWSAVHGRDGAAVSLPLLPPELAAMPYDKESGMTVEKFTDATIDGFCNFVSDFHPIFRASEMPVANIALGYVGTIDMLMYVPALGGIVVIGDGKTGASLDVGIFSQIGGYTHTTEAWVGPDREVVPMPHVDGGCILHLRPEYPRGYKLILIMDEDAAKAWEDFQVALDHFNRLSARRRTPGRVLYPPRPDGSQPAPRLDDLLASGFGSVFTVLSKAGYTDLGEVVALGEDGLLAIKGVGPKAIQSVRRACAIYDLTLPESAAAAAKEVA